MSLATGLAIAATIFLTLFSVSAHGALLSCEEASTQVVLARVASRRIMAAKPTTKEEYKGYILRCRDTEAGHEVSISAKNEADRKPIHIIGPRSLETALIAAKTYVDGLTMTSAD